MNTRISTLLGLALVTVTSFARADETVASPEPVRHEVVRSGAAGFGVGWAIGGADWGGLLLGSAFAFVGVLVGYVGAVAVDAGVLAKETVPGKATGLAIVPTFQATSQSARLGFAGQF